MVRGLSGRKAQSDSPGKVRGNGSHMVDLLQVPKRACGNRYKCSYIWTNRNFSVLSEDGGFWQCMIVRTIRVLPIFCKCGLLYTDNYTSTHLFRYILNSFWLKKHSNCGLVGFWNNLIFYFQVLRLWIAIYQIEKILFSGRGFEEV